MLFFPIIGKAQFFVDSQIIEGKSVPVASFLYKKSAEIVQQAALNVLVDFDVRSATGFTSDREYFVFSGNGFDLDLLRGLDCYFWAEPQGESKSILHAFAFKSGTHEIADVLSFAIVQQTVKNYLNAIEFESVNVTNQLFLSEQFLKVSKLNDELQVLHDNLLRLEKSAPSDTTQINQLRSVIRTKRAELNRETDVLSRFKTMTDW